jgi:hypothetical protein
MDLLEVYMFDLCPSEIHIYINDICMFHLRRSEILVCVNDICI